MKRKIFLTSQDKKDWEKFSKNLEGVYDKEIVFGKKDYQIKKNKRLDLHGITLLKANEMVTKFIIKSYEDGVDKIIIITGKGSRSKIYNDPYRSEKMNVLRHSVPEYIKNNEKLRDIIKEISEADIKDGGKGAIYIYLKRKKFIK